MVQIVIWRTRRQSTCGYSDLWTSVIKYNLADLRTPPNEQHSQEIANYNQSKITTNWISTGRRPPALRLSPVKCSEHTHQSPAGVPRFRALRGPRRQYVQNALPTGQRVGRRGPSSLLDYKLTVTRTGHSLILTNISPLCSLALIYPRNPQRPPPHGDTTGRMAYVQQARHNRSLCICRSLNTITEKNVTWSRCIE